MIFELFKTYNFNTLAPSILSTNFKNAVVKGILDYSGASKYFSPETKNFNIFPHLPVGTLSDPKKYTYILFNTNANIEVVLALQWIDQASVTAVDHVTFTIVVANASSGDDVAIREALTVLGFTSIAITST